MSFVEQINLLQASLGQTSKQTDRRTNPTAVSLLRIHAEGNNNTQKATIAPLSSTTRPQSWVEPHIHIHVHIHAGKFLPSVPSPPEEHNLPSACPHPVADPQPRTKNLTRAMSYHCTVFVTRIPDTYTIFLSK